MSITTVTLRQAQELVAEIHTGTPAGHVARASLWAAAEPERVAELLVALALMVNKTDGIPRLAEVPGLSEEVRAAAARRAHTLHGQGVRSPHVDAGERAYQREKSRRLRLRAAARPPVGEVA